MEEGNSTAATTLGKHTFSLDSLEDCPSTPVSASSGFASGAIVTGSALQGKKMITVFFLLVLLLLCGVLPTIIVYLKGEPNLFFSQTDGCSHLNTGVPRLLFTCCITMSKSLNLSEP